MIPLDARERESSVLRDGVFSADTYSVKRLEEEVAAYHGRSFAVAFDSPESALRARLWIHGNERNEVVVSALGPTHLYTAAAHAGYGLRYADINLDGSFHAGTLKAAAQKSTCTVVDRYLCGIVPVKPLQTYLPAQTAVITDATASLAPAAAEGTILWSLQEIMPLECESTGFVLTDNAEEASALQRCRRQGKQPGRAWNYDIVSDGADSALSALGAAVALRQTRRLGEACELRQAHALAYDSALGGHRLFDRMRRDAASVPQSYPLLLTPALYCPKEEIFTEVRDAGVEAGVCCKPVYKTTRFRQDGYSLPVTEDLYRALFQLPCHHRITLKEREKTLQTFLRAVETYRHRGCSF